MTKLATGGVWAPCSECFGRTGKVNKDCARCGGTDGYMSVGPAEPAPKRDILHDWYAMIPLTSPMLNVDRMWMCMKCGETSFVERPQIFGCDTTIPADWSVEDAELIKKGIIRAPVVVGAPCD